MQELLKKSVKHIVAVLILLLATIAYFSPSVLDGKVLRQGDDIKATGMGNSQMEQLHPASSAHGRMPCLAVCLMWQGMGVRLRICPSTK